MSLSENLQRFEQLIDTGEIASASAMLKHDPKFAKAHTKIDGEFVTPLDIAMRHGNVKLCDEILSQGARYDLPVGSPPQGGYGRTSLSKLLSVGFNKHLNCPEMIDVFAKHHSERSIKTQPQSIFTKFKEKASGILQDMSGTLQSVLASQTAKIGAIATPAAALGVKLGMVAAFGAAAGVVATPLLVSSVVLGTAGLLAHKLAVDKQDNEVGIRTRHETALSTIGKLAKLHAIAEQTPELNNKQTQGLASRFLRTFEEPANKPTKKHGMSLM